MWWKPWTWFRRTPPPVDPREKQSELEYKAALRQLNKATSDMREKRHRSATLDHVKQRVQDADDLMHQALGRKRMPSRG